MGRGRVLNGGIGVKPRWSNRSQWGSADRQVGMDSNPVPSTDALTVPSFVDVAVVGAGLAGLTAARVAAASGCSVAVFDGGAVGGRARSHDRGGFRFNLGPRALYLAGPGKGVLDRLHISRTGGPPWLAKATLLLNGELVSAPTSPRSFFSSPSLSAAGKLQLGTFMGKLGRIAPAKYATTTTDDWLEAQHLRQDVLLVLRGLIRLGTYCNDLDLLSADAAIASLQAAAKGVLYLDGGWQSLVDQLADGIDIHRSHVASVRGEGSQAAVTLADGAIVRAHTVVVAVSSPEAAQTLLATTLPPHGPPSKARCLNLGTARPAETPVVVGATEPLYLSMHSPPAHLLTGDRSSGAVVHVLRYLNCAEAASPADPAAVKAELFALAAKCGLSGDAIVESEYLHSMTVTSSMTTASTGGMAGRISATASGHPSILLAGDYVGPTGLLADCSLVSAEVAALSAIRRTQAAAARQR